VLLIAFLVIAYLFLKQNLTYLDPGSAIPDRVRMAYDALSEGVLIVDPARRVILANQAFRSLHPEAAGALTGKPLDGMGWLVADLGATAGVPPWTQAMRDSRVVSDLPLRIAQPGGTDAREVLVNCSPVLDGHRKVRGCLIAFADVTELHRTNQQLRATIDELETSREQIRTQNEELHRLATRDPLTGCLNRRAFFEKLATAIEQARESGQPLGCIMTDIDHFKQFNDKYGHAIGDLVLQAVARCLAAGVRSEDLLCRYGGEEFTIVLIGMTAEKTAEAAERLRVDIESHAGTAVRSSPGLAVTSSFGVAALTGEVDTADLMIERADLALYAAKHGGRNRVRIWDSGLAAA
jgi:diguanylate cyclase (GGDEF)-like protein